jgi:hypothetical protein
MALSSLPLPTDMIHSQFQGQHIGTVLTCEAQGLLLNISRLSTLAYHVALQFYYLQSIRLKLSYTTRRNPEDTSSTTTMPKLREIITHVICIGTPIDVVTPLLANGFHQSITISTMVQCCAIPILVLQPRALFDSRP